MLENKLRRRLMSERTKLLKKAVLTGVGASSNPERVKAALKDALDDLFKVGQGLLEDLESKGKNKTDSFENFLKNFKAEASKRGGEVSSKVTSSMKKAALEIGLATKEDLTEIAERLSALEEALVCNDDEGRKRSKPRRNHD